MPILRQKVTQTGADTFTVAAIDTNLSSEGKVGWAIKSLKAFWENGYTAAAADQTISAIIASQATVTTPSDPEELARVNYAIANTGGVAVAYPIDLQKKIDAAEDRVTVQPILYAQVSSVTTGLTNVMYFELEYEEVRMSELEFLRLLIGGA